MSDSIKNLNDLFKETYADNLHGLVKSAFGHKWTVERWLAEKDITAEDIERYPNAGKAVQIRSTKLYKALE